MHAWRGTRPTTCAVTCGRGRLAPFGLQATRARIFANPAWVTHNADDYRCRAATTTINAHLCIIQNGNNKGAARDTRESPMLVTVLCMRGYCFYRCQRRTDHT